MSGRMTPTEEPLDASGFRFVIVAARFNLDITERLVEGAIECFQAAGASDVPVHWVPGSYELPLACREVALGPPTGINGELGPAPWLRHPIVDGVVALGCVIRGETPHFDFVAGEAARGIMDVMLSSGVPISFGVLTTNDRAQADARAGGSRGNKGWDAAAGAIEMATLMRRLEKLEGR